MDAEAIILVKVIYKPVLINHDAIRRLCIGLVTWMHTFSPALMWIPGLQSLRKPFVNLHTLFNSDIPLSTIDMDFMNLNQSAHGGREFGFIGSRLGLERKVVGPMAGSRCVPQTGPLCPCGRRLAQRAAR